VPVSAGLAVLAAGVAIGALTDLQSSYGFVAAWLATAGLGIGMALAPAMDAVLDALPTEQAGSGTAITMTLRQTGGALGVALLGSLLAEGYASRVNTAGLPPEAAVAARESIAGALAAAAPRRDPQQPQRLTTEQSTDLDEGSMKVSSTTLWWYPMGV